LTGLLPPGREENYDPKPAADIHREHWYDYLYSPRLGGVTKNSCKNFLNICIVG
jgi:hypothetical protein